MALTWYDLGITIAINVVLGAAYVLLYSIFSVQRVNARVYFCRMFVKDEEDAKKRYEGVGVELNPLHYLHAFNWIWDSLKYNEQQLVEHAGLDMVLYLRMFVMAWKMFAPITVVACAVLLPVYITQAPSGDDTPEYVDVLTVNQLAVNSNFFWLPCFLAYLFNFWILYIMASEFKTAAQMRLDYVANQKDQPNQFSVLVRQIPASHQSECPQETEKFFQQMHPFTYQSTQACYQAGNLPALEPKAAYLKNRLEAFRIRSEKKGVRPQTSKGCFGPKVDAIDHMTEEIQSLDQEIKEKQEKVLTDPKAVLPACFVTFNSRRGAAVAAQTLQYHDPAKWVTTGAPEPRDVVWTNLSIPYLQGGFRKMAVAFVVFAIVVGYVIPVAVIQGFANLSTLQETFPFLQPLLEIKFVSAFLQGFLPGLGLTVVLLIVPPILLALSKSEGYVAQSEIDRAASGKNFYFKVVTVFLSSVLLGSAISDTQRMIENPNIIPGTLGSRIPAQSTFFITFTLINGWAGPAAELFRMIPLIIFHIKNKLLVVTPEDRVKAMSAPNPGYFDLVPDLEMYFLFSFMYMVIAPFYMPFVMVYYLWAYLVYRNQFINVYSPGYDLKGGFWPHFHARAIATLFMSQLVLILIFVLKQSFWPGIVLLPLPVLTLMINNTLIFERYGAIFKKVPLDHATHRDKEDSEKPESANRAFLEGAYVHPALKSFKGGDVEGGKGANEGAQLLDKVEEVAPEEPLADSATPASVTN